jgi:UDP-2,3-diacylglucosamine pyrophosphatase LpxH
MATQTCMAPTARSFAPPPSLALPTIAAAGPSDTLIVSDLHLGLPDSRPRDLLDFLIERPFGRLILLGDIFHDLSFRHLDADAWRLLRHLREVGQDKRRELVWLHGNHDRKLSRAISGLLGIDGREAYTWQQQGRRCVALHGDCFDDFVSRNARFGQLCSDVFAFCQRCLAPHHRWLTRLDAWHVRRIGLGERVAEKAVRNAARLAFDVVVCGHTHEPVVKRFDTAGGPVTYANTGAWVGRPASYVTMGPNGLALDFLP